MLFKKAAGNISLLRLNMLTYVFYVPLLLMSFIGSVMIVLELDNHYLINKIQNDETRYVGWAAIMYSMVMVPLGMLFSKKLFQIKSVKSVLANIAEKPIVNYLPKNEIILKSLLYLLSFVGIASLIYTFYHIGTIPLLEMINDSENLARLRQEAGREFDANVYIKNIFAINLLPILAFISWAYYNKSRNSLDLAWFVIMLIASLLILSYDLQKSPAALFLIGFIFYFTYVHGRIKLRYFMLLVIVFFSVILMFYSETTNINFEQAILTYNHGVIGRTVFSNIAGTFFSFEYFGSIHEFIGNRSLSTFVELFSVEHSERSSRIIMETINPQAVEAGTAGVINSLFIGEAWANYGLLGVILSPFYIGFLIGTLFYFFLRSSKTPVIIGLYVYFCYSSAVEGGFNDYIYNIGFLFIFFLFSTLLYISKYLNNKLT
ncbi:MAG: O-antigen polymerase [Chitinophagales bacterium]